MQVTVVPMLQPQALAIFQNLTNNDYDVFFDFDGLAGGDFESAIIGNITSRAHFLVLLTPSALERCNDPGDWLRREIETALESKRNIIPLMLDGFTFDTPSITSQLTGKLAQLKKYNVLKILPEYFEEGMARLRNKFLNVSRTTGAASSHPRLGTTRRDTTTERSKHETPAVQEKRTYPG